MGNLGEICALFLKQCQIGRNLSDHTLFAYRVDLNCFSMFVGSAMSPASINRDVLKAYQGHLRHKGYKPNTLRRRFACLRAMFNWLEEEELLLENPFRKFRVRYVVPHRLPPTLSRSEVAGLMRAVRGMSSKKMRLDTLNHQVTLELLYSTGIRVGELCSIRIGDIDIHEGRILIRGKGSRQRYVFALDKGLLEKLEEYWEFRSVAAKSSDRLMVTKGGSPMSTQFVRAIIKRIALLAGIKRNVTPHMLRHTAATHLLEEGVDLRFVQRLLGHQSLSTTQLYTHVSNENLRAALTKAFPVRKQIEREVRQSISVDNSRKGDLVGTFSGR